MKLLEDMPSAVAHHPPVRRTRATLLAVAVFLVVAALVGALLIRQGGSGDNADPVPLATWTGGATSACTTVSTDYPVMAQGPAARTDAANVDAVHAGTNALATTVRELALPTDPDERTSAEAAVAAGDRASQAWQALASADAATAEQLTEASGLTTAFVTALTELGATCTLG